MDRVHHEASTGSDFDYFKRARNDMGRKDEDEGERGCSAWLVVSLVAGLVVGLAVPINDTSSMRKKYSGALQAGQNRAYRE